MSRHREGVNLTRACVEIGTIWAEGGEGDVSSSPQTRLRRDPPSASSSDLA